jgi:archaellum biogenesis protein FlaJ (TadC family)
LAILKMPSRSIYFLLIVTILTVSLPQVSLAAAAKTENTSKEAAIEKKYGFQITADKALAGDKADYGRILDHINRQYALFQENGRASRRHSHNHGRIIRETGWRENSAAAVSSRAHWHRKSLI